MTCQEETPQDQTANPITESAHLCSPDKTVEAVILYPSLGMPMVLGPGQNICSLIIATGAEVSRRFEIDDWDPKTYQEAKFSIERHLRLMPIDAPKHTPKFKCAENVEQEGKPKGASVNGCGEWFKVARKSISVWPLGAIEDEMLINSKGGKPFAILAPRLFGSGNPYAGMTHLWEVEIDLLASGLMNEITDKKFLNWTWLVEMPKKCTTTHAENFFFNQKYPHYEPQDRMIEDYLRSLTSLRKPNGQRHYAHSRLYEVNLSKDKECYPLPLEPLDETKKYEKHLQSWHPVIRATSLPLKLAHLTDMHVNVRQDVLARSKTRVVEPVEDGELENEAVCSLVKGKVAHAFWSFKELIEEMSKRKKNVDTALLLTGDYIDFNRNINPWEEKSGIGEQWKAFNILANADTENSKLYLRGVDDTLVYSLVRNAYTTHKMPVFMINGNHDAYQFPYGISPRAARRLDGWVVTLSRLEGELRKKEKEFKTCQKDHKSCLQKEVEDLRKKLEKHRGKLDEASKWQSRLLNEEVVADHNLTFYEATLAYGPTYGQVMTSENFSAEQFDWFHALFTPFSDAVLFLGAESDKLDSKARQILALLGWGGRERGVNTSNFVSEFTGVTMGADQRSLGFLPYAKKSINDSQIKLLAHAAERKGSRTPFIVASHFTIFNYDYQKSFSEEGSFVPEDKPQTSPVTVDERSAQYNKFNYGSCERMVRKYLDKYTCPRTQNSQAENIKKVDWHFSGHSHRMGVYDYEWEGKNVTFSAWDPGLQQQPDDLHIGTQFVVSSSAGSIGKQNLKGELGGELLRPPSGSFVDVKEWEVEQVKAAPNPRLCVILDYMAVLNRSKKAVPIRFAVESNESFKKIGVNLSEEMVLRNCLNLKDLKIWLFQRTETKNGYSVEWHKICRKGSKEETTGRWHEMSDTSDKTKYSLNLSPKAIEKIGDCLVKPSTYDDLLEINEMEKSARKNKDQDVLKRTKTEREDTLKRARNSTGDILLKYVLQAFCEIPLNKPQIVDSDDPDCANQWIEDLNCDDPWIFPLEIGIADLKVGISDSAIPYHFIRRPYGEKGEVPDWWFRAKYFEDKYIQALDAVDPQPDEEPNSNDTTSSSPPHSVGEKNDIR